MSLLTPVLVHFQFPSLNENLGCVVDTARAAVDADGMGPVGLETGATAVTKDWILKRPLLMRWRIQLPWEKPRAISHEGACQLEGTLLAQIITLNNSKASVANKIAGLNHWMWSMRL
jgi:hypothetical protein